MPTRRPARCWWREGGLTCPREKRTEKRTEKLTMNRLQSSAFDGAGINYMATEEVDPRFADLDAWSLTSAMEAMWEGQLAAVAAIGHALPAITAATEAAKAALGDHGRIVYVGAGTSGRVAVQDGAELMPTFAWPSERVRFIVAGGDSAFVTSIEGAEDDVDNAVTQINATQLTPHDVVIAVDASGKTQFTIAALTPASSLGAMTIGIATHQRTARTAAEH